MKTSSAIVFFQRRVIEKTSHRKTGMAPKRKTNGDGEQPKIDVAALKPGAYLSSHNYYVVDSVDKDVVVVRDMSGERVSIGVAVVRAECLASHQFFEDRKVTRTELSHILQNIGHAVFRVTFKKQATADSVAAGLDSEDVSTTAKRLKVIKKRLEGQERVLHGRLHRTTENDPDVEFGRIKVVDLEVASSSSSACAFRLVDTRSITELVVEGVRYYV